MASRFSAVTYSDGGGGGGGGGDGMYGRQAAPGHYVTGLMQLQVEVDRKHVNRRAAAVAGGGEGVARLLYPMMASDNPLDRHILEGELVAQINRKGHRSNTGVLGHPALVSNPVGVEKPQDFVEPYSAAMLAAQPPSTDKVHREGENIRAAVTAVLRNVIPFGVSRSTVPPNAPAGFVTAVGGVLQTRNIGEEFVQPGDILTLDMPTEDEHMRPADPGAPLTKKNWVARKVAYATPAHAMLDEMQAGRGDVGAALLALIETAQKYGGAPEDVLDEPAMQKAVAEFHAETMNTFQVLRRLELGMVLRGARRGEPMLFKMW